MNSLISRLWNASPGSLSRGLLRRLKGQTGQPGWVRIQTGPLAGKEMLVPAGGRGAWKPMADGSFDRFFYDALLPKLNPRGAVIWDIGAHFGYHSLCCAALGAEVLAFEPNASNVAQFKQSLDRNPALAAHIRYRVAALSDTDGEMTFVQSDDLRGQSSGCHLASALPPLEPAAYANFSNKVVPTLRLDTVLAQGERPPQALKIDVEGAELLVLKGGAEFFPRCKPLLLIEIHHIRLMFEVGKLLAGWGYQTRLLDDPDASASRCFMLAEAG
jgi:FkbM family methyltransferase